MTTTEASTNLRERIDHGIPGYQKIFYHISIKYSVDRSIAAFERYDSELQQSDENSADAIVSSVHEALGHAAAVSRYFWNYSGDKEFKKLHRSRGKELRSMYELSDNSPLNNRDLRNALEHYDERLDRFLFEEHAGLHMPMSIVDRFEPGASNNHKIYKLVDPDQEIFVVFGAKFDFGGIRQEIVKMKR